MKKSAGRHTRNDYQKDFIKLFQSLAGYKRSKWDVWSNFLEVSAYSLAYPMQGKLLKEEFQLIQNRTDRETLEIYSQMFDLMVNALEIKYHDFLGDCAGAIEVTNANSGQFFTPYPICNSMAQISVCDASRIIEDKGYVTISDPCSGSGSMLIAAISQLRNEGYNHSTQAYVVAQDIDLNAFYMSYIQLSLCGSAGEVILGDSLKGAKDKTWYLPATYFSEVWLYRLMTKRLNSIEAVPELNTQVEQKEQQLTMF